MGSLLSLKQSLQLKTQHLPQLCRDISRAVLFLHDQDITHRDIKLDNILVFQTEGKDAQFQPKLSDFGFSGDCKPSTDYKGTPKGYMAP